MLSQSTRLSVRGARFAPSVRNYLYVIQSPNLEGLAIYSKGKLVREGGSEVYYFLVSSKKAL